MRRGSAAGDPALLAADFFKQGHGAVGTHVVLVGHALRYTVDLITSRAGNKCNISGVQCHVPALDAFGGERAQRTNVLRQTDSDRNLAQLLG